MNALNSEFERLKQVFRQPRLCMHNFFSDLRAEIDLVYALKQDEENRKTWLELISKVDTYERECLREFKNYEPQLVEDTSAKMLFVGGKLKFLNSHSVEINDRASSAENLIDELTYLVSDQVFALEKYLFLNQKMIFIDLKNYQMIDSHKLIFIKNEYFGRAVSQMIKKYKFLK